MPVSLVVALAMVGLAACSHVVSGTPSALGAIHTDATASAPLPSGTGCAPQATPAGASPAAVAYLRAVARAEPGWSQIDRTLAAEGNIVHKNDFIAQVNADTTFVSYVTTIAFPAAIQPVATRLVEAIQQYDGLLQMSYANDGFYAAHHAVVGALDERRAEASAELRAELRLPPSKCTFRRP